MDLLSDYCITWALQNNLTKTKVIPFTTRRSLRSPIHILLNGEEIEVVKEYKYLGLLLSANGSLKPAINTLAAQANKALFALMKSAARLKYPSPSLLAHLFDSLVSPIMEYACEVWATTKADEIEVIHRRSCKFALGLPTSATNVAVYGDLGRMPLSIKFQVALIKYWLRITGPGEICPLLREAYQLISSDQSNRWVREIKRLLCLVEPSWNQPSGSYQRSPTKTI